MTDCGAIINESVILLHGLARSKRSLSTLETELKYQGYHTVNLNYPSTKFNVETLAENIITKALSQCPAEHKVHFVTHSLGGILVRHYLNHHQIKNLGRVVMLGPPNRGSQVVDKLKSLFLFQLINGPAGLQLGTEVSSAPNSTGPVNFDVGIIAGTKSFNLILSTILPNQNDGKVSVENTKIEGMSDHTCLPVTHTFMMNDKTVVDEVKYFLKHGAFSSKL